jgi:NAD(P)-dependent dehydrogenase (short-subunit alcohol dehydrogenase family)
MQTTSTFLSLRESPSRKRCHPLFLALSEGLRLELAPRGIGVSLLCPGHVHTKIMDSVRNLPELFPRPSEQTLNTIRSSKPFQMIQDRVLKGVDPQYVGELVREGIENDWAYNFTDIEFEPMVAARFAAIKASFDQIREREPR